ncbi:hypothetical protein GCM10020001_061280 [Nonomuraea salmonea]
MGPAGSPLEAVALQASAVYVPVPVTGQSRSNLWLLSVPPIVAAAALGLVQADADLFERVARSLEDIAHRCRPSSESFINPGKSLALDLAETVPMVWGSSQVAGGWRRTGWSVSSRLARNIPPCTASCPRPATIRWRRSTGRWPSVTSSPTPRAAR